MGLPKESTATYDTIIQESPKSPLIGDKKQMSSDKEEHGLMQDFPTELVSEGVSEESTEESTEFLGAGGASYPTPHPTTTLLTAPCCTRLDQLC